MAATIFGFTANEIKPQPGFSAQANDNGGWTGTHEFAIRAVDYATTAASFARGTQLTTLDPSIPSEFSFLRITDVRVTRVEGDFIFLSVTATGSPIDQWESGDEPGLSTQAEPTYSLRGSLSERPILEHPKAIALGAIERTLLSRLMDGDEQCRYNQDLQQFGYFEVESDVVAGPGTSNTKQIWFALGPEGTTTPYTLSDECKKFAELISKGETTYLVPNITWTETTEGEQQLTAQQINKLGKVSPPRGNPPSPSDGRNWMLTSATSDQQGLLHRTQIEWTLSDENGWDDFLYD